MAHASVVISAISGGTSVYAAGSNALMLSTEELTRREITRHAGSPTAIPAATQRHAIAALLARMTRESPLLTPDADPDHRPGIEGVASAAGAAIERLTHLRTSASRRAGWLGLECGDVRPAVWMMRALVAGNVLSRREGTVLYVPINATLDPGGERVTAAVAHVVRCARARAVIAGGGASPVEPVEA